MKRGDLYSFQTQFGVTRIGKIVRKDEESIIVLYKAEQRTRTRKILLKDVIKKNIIKEV